MASRKQQAAQARAKARGFRTVYQMRKFERENKAIGGAAAPTVTRQLRQAQDTVRGNRTSRRDALLASFGVTLAEYNRKDRENRGWFDAELARRNKAGMEHLQKAFLKSATYHTYREWVADDVNWTRAKVGYVLAFHAANVSRRTGYWSMYKDPLNTRKGKNFGGRERDQVGGFDKMNAAQYFYLTQVTDLMTVNEYEVTYGSQQTRQQAAVPPSQAVA